MTSLAHEQFRIGAVIGRSFSVLRNNLVPFGILYLVLNAPSSIYEIKMAGRYDADGDSVVRILTLIETFLSYLATAAVTYGTIQELRGQRVGFREFCARGLAQGGVAIRVALLSGVGLILGVIAFVVPALVLYTMWWVAIPVAVTERMGAFASLRRSTQLTKGYRWQILGLMLAFFVAAAVIGVVFVIVVGVPVGLFASGGDVLFRRMMVTLIWLWQAALLAAQAVLTAVGYYHLRVAKEGIGIDDLAAVFD